MAGFCTVSAFWHQIHYDCSMQPERIRTELCASAAHDYRYLLSRAYPAKSALEFVGNHFQLRREERDFLFRAVCSPERAVARRAKTVSVQDIEGCRLVVDGYNCLITLENALRGRSLVMGDDGFVRDVARVFRKFRPTELTKQAYRLIVSLLSSCPPDETLVFLDAKMSASGELASRINRWSEDDGIHLRCITVRCAEKRLAGLKGIKASADSVIIDGADRVFDLAGYIIINRLGHDPLRLPVDERHGVT